MALTLFFLIAAGIATLKYLHYVKRHVRPQYQFIAYDVVHECVFIPLFQSAIFAVFIPWLVALQSSEVILGCSLLLYCSVMRFVPCALTRALDIQPLEQFLVRFRFGLFVWYLIAAWGTYQFALRTGAPWFGLAAHAGLNFVLCLVCLASGRTDIHERKKTVDD